MRITNPMAEHETENRFQKRPNNTLLIQLFFIIHYDHSNSFFHYTNYNKTQKCNWSSKSFQQSDHWPPLSQGIRVSSEEHQDLLNKKAPKSLPPQQGLPPQRRRPGRLYGFMSAIRCAMQDETDRPSYPLIWQ
jgi:hypothetical protein